MVVPTGIQLEKFKSTNHDKEKVLALKESLGIKKDEFVYFFLGRISKEKSIDVLLDAFAKIEKDVEAKFLIVGDGPAMSELKDRVKKLKIESKVIFTGFVNWTEVGLYYQVGDAIINASVTETQGLTYIEALAASLPVIVKYDACLLDVINDNDNGLFFRNNEELPLMMKNIYADKDLSARLKENASKSIEKYSQECYASNALKAYNRAIEINKASK